MRRLGGAVLATALITGCGPSQTGELNDSLGQGAQLAAACAGCHSPVSAPGFVDLSGYNAETLSARLQAYRNNPEGTTVMHRLARGYSDGDIASVSAYIAAQNVGLQP